MHKTLLRVALVAALFSPLSVLLPNVALADTVQVNFENPPYSAGSINGQDGWIKTGTFDANVIPSSVANFGSQSLQISDAVTSGSFGDQTFAKPLTNAVGESGATASTFSVGTKQPHFEMQFDLASAVPGAQQPGETMSVSPDRGDGSRMSYLRFEDQADGIHVFFDDVTDAGPVGTVATFNESDIATLNRATAHTIKLTLDTIDGPHNDVVKVYIDGVLKKTGTSWEDYYRYDPEASAEQSPRIVKTVLFRESATANPSDAGKGYLIDNLTLTSGPAPVSATVVVTPANLHSWTTDDTRPGGAVTYVTDGTTPSGTGALQLTTDNTTTSKAQYMQYTNGVPTPLSSVTELSYYTKQNSAAFAGGDASYQLPVLLNGTTGFTTFVFEPYENGSVVPGTWQHWDVTKGQFWSSKSITCSNGTITAGNGGAPFYTLSQIETLCPSATVTGFGVNIGSNNPSYTVETDLVSFNGTAYDFEPAPVAPATGSIVITKYVCPANTVVTRTANGVGGTVPTGCTADSGKTFGYVHGTQTDANAPDPELAGPFIAGGTTGSNGMLTIPNLDATGRYLVVETDSTNAQLAANKVLGLYCAGDGDTSGTNDNQELTFVPAGGSTNCVAYDPAPVVPQVHIFKYVNNAPATASTANNATFPMNASWVSSTLGTVPSVGFTLSPTPWGPTDVAYEASYVGGAAGDNYATNEVTTGPVVGASCADGKPFALAGYSTGDTLASAFTNASSTVSPSFTNLQSDKYVIVWNRTCPVAPTGTGSISGYKFEDWDGDGSPFETQWEVGLKGWTIYLDMDNSGTFNAGDIATTTNKNGKYTFTNLPAGTYHVREVQQAGWTQTYPSATAATDQWTVSLATEQKVTKKDFGNFKLGLISGTVYNDKNNNGNKNSGEVGLAGWVVKLKGPNGTTIATTTDANGNYSFTGLTVGKYTLSETLQSGWKQTDYPDTVKVDSATDSTKDNFGNYKK